MRTKYRYTIWRRSTQQEVGWDCLSRRHLPAEYVIVEAGMGKHQWVLNFPDTSYVFSTAILREIVAFSNQFKKEKKVNISLSEDGNIVPDLLILDQRKLLNALDIAQKIARLSPLDKEVSEAASMAAIGLSKMLVLCVKKAPQQEPQPNAAQPLLAGIEEGSIPQPVIPIDHTEEEPF